MLYLFHTTADFFTFVTAAALLTMYVHLAFVWMWPNWWWQSMSLTSRLLLTTIVGIAVSLLALANILFSAVDALVFTINQSEKPVPYLQIAMGLPALAAVAVWWNGEVMRLDPSPNADQRKDYL